MDKFSAEYNKICRFFQHTYEALTPEDIDEDKRNEITPQEIAFPRRRRYQDLLDNGIGINRIKKYMNDISASPGDDVFTMEDVSLDVYTWFGAYLQRAHVILNLIGYDINPLSIEVTFLDQSHLLQDIASEQDGREYTLTIQSSSIIGEENEEHEEVNIEEDLPFGQIIRNLNVIFIGPKQGSLNVNDIIKFTDIQPGNRYRHISKKLPPLTNFTVLRLKTETIGQYQDWNEFFRSILSTGISNNDNLSIRSILKNTINGVYTVLTDTNNIVRVPQGSNTFNLETMALVLNYGVISTVYEEFELNLLTSSVVNYGYDQIIQYLGLDDIQRKVSITIRQIILGLPYDFDLDVIFDSFILVNWQVVWWNYYVDDDDALVNDFVKLWCILMLIKCGDVTEESCDVLPPDTSLPPYTIKLFKDNKPGTEVEPSVFKQNVQLLGDRSFNPKEVRIPLNTYHYPPGSGQALFKGTPFATIDDKKRMIHLTSRLLSRDYTFLTIRNLLV